MPRVSGKFFFDICCPNSWLGYLSLQKKLLANPSVSMEYVPVCDFKIKLFRAYIQTGQSKNTYMPLTKLDKSEVKLSFANYLDVIFPENYKEIHQSYIHNAALANIFTSAMRIYKPEVFHKAVNHLGNRIWNDQKLLTQGAHYWTISKEIGLEFRESEFIISHLAHRDPKKELDLGSKAVADIGGVRSPMLSLDVDGEILNMEDFNGAFKYF